MNELENNTEQNNNLKKTPVNRVPLEIKPIPLIEQSEKIPVRNTSSEQKELLDLESKNPIEIIKEEIREDSIKVNVVEKMNTPKKEVGVIIDKKTPFVATKEKQEVKVEILKNTDDDISKKKKPANINNIKGKEKKFVIKTIRTYKGDVLGALKTQKTSLSDIILSKKKKEGYGKIKEDKKPANLKIITIISFIIILGLGVFGIFYILTRENTPVVIEVKQQKVSTIIFPNYQKEVILSNLKEKTITEAILFEQQDISIPLTSIVQIFFTKDDPTGEFAIEEVGENKILITADSFLEAFETRASSALLRSIDSDFMFGYHSSLGNNPFLIFKVRSYENAFAGMLEWEKTMFKEFYSFFKRETSSIGEESNIFKDIIIVNKDVRAILGIDGKIEFAYSFPDKETLVIINNETTLIEIYRRLNISKMERQN